ncbi:type II secretion system F family protein [Pseudonocardia sp. Ae717_Ps2]|uniref:type II secretion system F family protein n=1 Tax=Pseudonocardia sp. Ae717_Ps2 TaxID=1885573 RepID=UPI00094B540C|nr:type II secretion system F family protein [Pseudonocardia sp. Ae717_Ps2]
MLVPSGAALGGALGGMGGAVVGAALGGGLLWLARRAARGPAASVDSADLAAAWDLLATCLAAGLAVADAVGAAARRLDGPAGEALRRVAGLLALGADPDDAWAAPARSPNSPGSPARGPVGPHRCRPSDAPPRSASPRWGSASCPPSWSSASCRS